MRKFVVELAEKIKNADVVDSYPVINGYKIQPWISVEDRYAMSFAKKIADDNFICHQYRVSKLEFLYLQEAIKTYNKRVQNKISEDLGIDLNEKED